MNILASYLPIDRRLALAKGESLNTQPWGAVLMADVSGFTPLTVAYVEALGPRQGAEELIHQINSVYEQLIAETHRFGGSVIYFSGDAITCWFDSDDGQRATACALAMQEQMQAFAALETPMRKVVSLTIKIAIAAGQARRFVLGDPAITQLDVLVGSPLSRMAAAESLAQPQEIVASEEIIQAAPGKYWVREWRKKEATLERFAVIGGLTSPVLPTPWPSEASHSQLDDALVRPWLTPTVYERLRSSTDQYLSELRPVVALFLRFSGLDYEGDVAVEEKLRAYIDWVQHIVYRYEGYLLQLTTGDKGSYLYAAFGAMVAHENDADRALLTARALCELPTELNFIESFQIGISRGQMRVGPYGSQARRTYGAFGHETNMAARLMALATPGEVIVSQYTLDAVKRRQDFQFTSLGEVTVKGNTQPIAVYRLAKAGQKTAVAQTSYANLETSREQRVLVGRQQEQQLFWEKLQLLRSGQRQALVITGDAGIGKSLFVQSLLEATRADGVQVLLGEANAIEQASPYYAWRAIFYNFFQLDKAPPEPQARQAYVLSQLPPDKPLQTLIPLLNAVLALDFPENELTQEMSGLGRANKTHELLTAVLQHAAAQRPLLLVLEDAHWLDSASWALAEAVFQAVHPLLLLLVTRPFDDSREPGQLSSLLTAPITQHIRLRRLSLEDSLTLVCQRLGVPSLPKPIADFIVERAEGHPFFSEELAYSLREAHLIEIVNGTCQLTLDPAEMRRLDFPTTIEGVITSRIDRLKPAQQIVIKISSVIGRIFAYKILHDIHPITLAHSDLSNYLQDLQRLDITLLESPEPDLAYIFKHIITQQVAYNLLLFAQRRELHQKVAQWYEAQYGTSSESMAPLLAHHWRQSLDINSPAPALATKAIFYAEQAGDQAVRKYANQEAIYFFSDAQAIASRLPNEPIAPSERQAHWSLQLGEAYLGLGQLTEARERFEHCLQLLGWPVAAANGRLALVLLKEVIWRLFPQRTHELTPARQQALQEAARAYELLGQVYYLTNQPLPTLYAMIRGLNLAEQVGASTPELARAYANMSGAVSLIPLPKQSRRFEARAWETVRDLNNLTTLAYVAFITSIHKINIAAWDEGNQGFAQGLDLANQLGDRRTAGFCLSGMGHIALYRGHFRQSMALFRQLEALAETAQDVTHWSTALGAIGAIHLQQGRWAEGLACLEKGLPLALKAGNALAEWACRAREAQAHFWLNQPDEAEAKVVAGIEYALQAPHTSFANIAVYLDLLTVLLWQQEQQLKTTADRPAKTKALLRRYGQYTRIFPFASPSYKRLKGWHEWLNGRFATAFHTWQTALSAATGSQNPYEIGLIHYEIGRHLAANDPQRPYHLQQALTILEELEATMAAQQARQALHPSPAILPNQ